MPPKKKLAGVIKLQIKAGVATPAPPVGPALGRGEGSFDDDFELTRSRAVGSDVLLDLRPRTDDGFVMSALYDGPLLFATC